MARIKILVTTFENVDLSHAIESWRELGFVENSVLPRLHIVSGTIDTDAMSRLAGKPGVKAVEPEKEVRTLS